MLILLAAGSFAILNAGCPSKSDRPAKNDPTEKTELLKNNSSKIAYDAVPGSFEKFADSLLSRKLTKVTSGSGPSMGKRFEVLKDTGIDFANSLDREKYPYQLIETGSGVALGDYDNDGLTDIYLVGADLQNKLYRATGDFKFEDVTQKTGVDGRVNGQEVWGSSASFADIDNDGDLDLFVCNMAAPNLLYVNQGDGSFLEQSVERNVAYQGASKSANFCDYDRDGDLDMYLLTYQDFVSSGEDAFETVDGVKRVKQDQLEYHALIAGRPAYAGEKDIFYRNDGNGVFIDATDEAGISGYDRGLSCVWFDYDNDGWQDIYVGSDFKMPDHLYRNNRDGTFTDVLPKVVRHTPWFSMGLDTGDLNNDGLLDLMVADMSSTSHYKQKLNMGGMNDSNWFLDQGEPRQYMKNAVLVNSGAEAFMEVAKMTGLSSTDWTWAVRFVDLDNDGLLDVFVTNGHARDAMNADISDRFTKLEESGAPRSEIDRLYAQIPAVTEPNLAFKNLGDLKFQPVGSDWNLDHEGVSHAAAFADFDDDGDLDLVINNYYEQTMVYRNNSTQGNRVMVELRCQDNNFYGYGSKVEIWQGENHYLRELHPVRGYLASDAPAVHFGLGDAETIDRMKVTWPDGSSQEFTELPTDRLYRVIESPDRLPESSSKANAIVQTQFQDSAAKLGLNFKHQETEFNDYLNEPLLPYQLSELGSGIAWGDVNGDGYPDAFCGGAAGQSGQLFINQEGKKFEKVAGPWNDSVDCEDTGILFFDAEGDGDLDLYIASGSNEGDAQSLRDRLYLNSGNSTFENAAAIALPDVSDSSSSVSAVDFDHDGDLDLFVGSRSVPGKYPVTPTSRLLINDNGKFTVAPEETAPGLNEVGLVNSAVWSDYNGDGWHDLFLALDWGPVAVFKNDKGTLTNVTSELGIDDKLGWWHGIATADLDDDGDIDYVVTNQGRNTKYHADKKHPHRLYYDDFDNNGTMDLVETEFEGDTEFPVRGRSCSSSTMPFIAEKFETYHDFALASVAEIYEPEIKDRPMREVNFLDSAIFWNDGDKFRVESMPYLAQISPGYGIQVADFDGDSQLDILMANNFFGPQPETGYMDGGLGWFLKGSGNGQFAAVWPNQSGVVLNKDSNGLAVADFDLDGDLDALVGVSNSEVQLLENKTQLTKSLRVKIEGPKSNPNAIGARVKLVGPDASRVIELNGGSSYLSQACNLNLSVSQAASKKFGSIEVHWPDGSISKHALDWNIDEPIVLRHQSND